MKTFRDLTVRGSRGDVARILGAINAALTAPWRRDEHGEGQLSDPHYICYRRDGGGDAPEARLWLLVSPNERELTVANVVPVDVMDSPLSYEAYNDIVEDFYRRFFEPAALQSGNEPVLSSDEWQIESVLSPSTTRLLHGFSHFANRGGLHPLDRDRWYDFVIAAHRENTTLDAPRLTRWLTEEEHWPEDRARDLAAEYDAQREILRKFDRTVPIGA
jgi:hypothetical protein